jgi:ABC-2 type transport system permease protein
MRDILKVFKFEFLTVLRRRSFILSLILVPLIPSLLLGVLNLINQDESLSFQEIFVQEVANPLPIGVVDMGNVIKEYPDWLTQGRLVPEVSEEEARQKTAAGQLQGFYVIEPDYLETGRMRFIKPQISMITELLQQDLLKDLINYNLLGADQERFMRFMNPTTFTFEYLNPETADTRDQSNAATYWVPYAVTMFFYMIILISSGLMLNAVTKDKENKTIEILLSSAKPLDLFLGKILAFGSLSLTQMLIWLGSLVLLMDVGKTSLPFLQNISIPINVIVASVPFFIGGFLLYGSLMAGMGAVAPNLREGNQSTFVLNLPLIFTVMSINQLIETPFSTFTTFMTLFPFTSPVVMLTRLSVGPVPAWQLIISLALLFGTVIIVIRGVANLFSSQYLLSGQKMNIGVFLRTVLIGHRRA